MLYPFGALRQVAACARAIGGERRYTGAVVNADDKPRRIPYPYPTCPHCGREEVQRRPMGNPPEGIDYFQCRACSEVWTIRSKYTHADSS